MALYQILYWQDIPSQIKVWDDFDEVKVELSNKFMIMIDQKAKEKKLTDAEDYLNQWKWSDEMEIEGDVEDVAEKIKNDLENKFE